MTGIDSLKRYFPSFTSFAWIHEIGGLDESKRRELIRILVEKRYSEESSAVPDAIIRALASRTDGYLPSDLTHLMDHVFLLQTYKSHLSSCSVSLDDVIAALRACPPIRLGVITAKSNSDIAWDDIYGMDEVKRVLLETVTWPTRYAFLFRSCPIPPRKG
jgi:peroxin-1